MNITEKIVRESNEFQKILNFLTMRTNDHQPKLKKKHAHSIFVLRGRVIFWINSVFVLKTVKMRKKKIHNIVSISILLNSTNISPNIMDYSPIKKVRIVYTMTLSLCVGQEGHFQACTRSIDLKDWIILSHKENLYLFVCEKSS